MKIGILTFQREPNDGSLLQCFCLYRFLRERYPDARVEVIDFQPKMLRGKHRTMYLSRRPPFLRSDKLKRLKISQHERFAQEHIAFSPPLRVGNSAEEGLIAIAAQHYDAIVVGSDTVWDTRPNGGAPQPPNAFFLPGLQDTVKIAMAASMDKGGPRFVPADTWNRLMENIADFDFISVRDQATANWLTDGGVPKQRVRFLPDPTLLYDFSKIVEPPELPLRQFPKVAAVAVSDVRLRKEMTRQLQELEFTVINLLGLPVRGQHSTPRHFTLGERLGLYPLLDFLVTDRFHGSILTLKQSPETPVLLVEPDSFYDQPDSKGRDLFGRLGLERMVWRYHASDSIPDGLVQRFGDIWHTQPNAVPASIDNMREQAGNVLREIDSLLNPQRESSA